MTRKSEDERELGICSMYGENPIIGGLWFDSTNLNINFSGDFTEGRAWSGFVLSFLTDCVFDSIVWQWCFFCVR